MANVIKYTQVERWVAIADEIAAGNRPTVRELAIKFGVSFNTISRDLRNPYVLKQVKKRLLEESKPQDIKDVMDCLRKAIADGDTVTARWYYERLFDGENDTKDDLEARITAKILGTLNQEKDDGYEDEPLEDEGNNE